jgi:intracellular septation protein
MQLLVDFFPLLLFFITYLYSLDIYLAMKVLMVAMPIAFAIKWWLTGKFDKMMFGSIIALFIFGSAALLLKDPVYLYWKPTVFYWVMALVLLGSQFIGKKPLVARMFAEIGEVPDQRWRQLNIVWVLFFILSGVLNVYVFKNFSEPTWVKFKVFGFTALTFIFIVVQMMWLSKYLKQPDSEEAVEPEATSQAKSADDTAESE